MRLSLMEKVSAILDLQWSRQITPSQSQRMIPGRDWAQAHQQTRAPLPIRPSPLLQPVLFRAAHFLLQDSHRNTPRPGSGPRQAIPPQVRLHQELRREQDSLRGNSGMAP